MSTIDLTFTNGELTGLVSNSSWYASYYVHGEYYTSTAEADGVYNVFNESVPGVSTVIDTASFVPLYTTSQFLAFNDPPAPGAATPELSTCLMLTIGLGFLLAFRKRKVHYAKA